MKKSVGFALVYVVALSLAAVSQTGGDRTAERVKQLEHEWAQATVKNGATAVDQYEADDIIDTDPAGNVTNKAQDRQAASSGDLKFESLEPSEIQVHVYGNAAVAAGIVTVKGTYKQARY